MTSCFPSHESELPCGVLNPPPPASSMVMTLLRWQTETGENLCLAVGWEEMKSSPLSLSIMAVRSSLHPLAAQSCGNAARQSCDRNSPGGRRLRGGNKLSCVMWLRAPHSPLCNQALLPTSNLVWRAPSPSELATPTNTHIHQTRTVYTADWWWFSQKTTYF